MDSIIGGASALDVPELHVTSLQEAEDFLACYGYEWDRPTDRAVIDHCRVEAMALMIEELLPGTALCIPEEVHNQRDLRQLMIMASQKPRGDQQRWACAVLRVMHTVAHSQSYFNQRFGAQIRTQILQRFEPHLDEDRLILGHGDEAIALERFEAKQAKSLRSIVMKLLHKAENVAADVFDRVGVRLVTRERLMHSWRCVTCARTMSSCSPTSSPAARATP